MEVLEADILAVAVRVSVAAETLAEEARASVAVEILEEARALAAPDTSAVAFCILVRELSAFHHLERVNFK